MHFNVYTFLETELSDACSPLGNLYPADDSPLNSARIEAIAL